MQKPKERSPIRKCFDCLCVLRVTHLVDSDWGGECPRCLRLYLIDVDIVP